MKEQLVLGKLDVLLGGVNDALRTRLESRFKLGNVSARIEL